ncbi:hypothetical protein BDD12DRAFT_849947 [Trichophaea hybrida]|nr:hypothetical protein BDD12DRAFT_849947 [Trichophaea hybrida]
MSISPPSVALLGATGFMGKPITPTFISALQAKKISRLVILTRDASNMQPFDEAVEVRQISYDEKSQVVDALKGVDVLISTMGTKGDVKQIKQNLVEAAAEVGVKVYVSSEWGTDHTSISHYHTMFQAKRDHISAAESLGLKAIAIFTSLITEITFCKWFGFDTASATWSIVGDGIAPLALTSQRDLGPATLQTILLAHYTPEKCPKYVRIASMNNTLREYANAFESESGEALKLQFSGLTEAWEDYNKIKASLPRGMLGPLLPIMMAEGVLDHTRNDNELINPGEKYFKWKTIEEYAKEVNGRPWDNGSVPF